MLKKEVFIIALCISLVMIGASHAKVYEWVDGDVHKYINNYEGVILCGRSAFDL